MAIIETTIPLGKGDGTVATASKPSDAHKDRVYIDDGVSVVHIDQTNMRRILCEQFFLVIILYLIPFSIAFIGPLKLLLNGARDKIAWKQLVGGCGFMSVMVWIVGPAASQDDWHGNPHSRRAGKLHRLGMLVIKGVIVVVSVFINMLFAALAFWMGDRGSGNWWVTLLLLCLQIFVGVRIVRGLPHCWVRAAALVFYNFGVSAFYVGSWGLCSLVASRLSANYELALGFSLLALSYALMFVSKMRYGYPESWNPNWEEQEEWRDHVRRVEVGYFFGDFRYIEKN